MLELVPVHNSLHKLWLISSGIIYLVILKQSLMQLHPNSEKFINYDSLEKKQWWMRTCKLSKSKFLPTHLPGRPWENPLCLQHFSCCNPMSLSQKNRCDPWTINSKIELCANELCVEWIVRSSTVPVKYFLEE